MKINLKKPSIFLPISLFIFSCYAFFILYDKIKENVVIAKEANIEMQKQTNHLNETKLLRRGIEIIKREKKEFEKHFTQGSNLVPFLDNIEGLARRVGANAEVTSVDISPDKLSLLVGLEAEGNFSSLYKFINLLENSDHELEFTSLDLSRKTTQEISSIPRWTVKIRIKLISFIN